LEKLQLQLAWVCTSCGAEGALVSHAPAACPRCSARVEPTSRVAATWQELALRLHDAEHMLHRIESFHQEWADKIQNGDLTSAEAVVVEEMLEELQTFLPWDDDNEHGSWLWLSTMELPDAS
jgi:hypothetical protein